jgi:hypothetical protein
MKTSRDFPHHIITNKDNHWEATNWCEQHFGKRWSIVDNRQGIWCCFWRGTRSPGGYDWHFLNEKDAFLFSLKWL